jgi:hypothetical protein
MCRQSNKASPLFTGRNAMPRYPSAITSVLNLVLRSIPSACQAFFNAGIAMRSRQYSGFTDAIGTYRSPRRRLPLTMRAHAIFSPRMPHTHMNDEFLLQNKAMSLQNFGAVHTTTVLFLNAAAERLHALDLKSVVHQVVRNHSLIYHILRCNIKASRQSCG